MIAVQAILLLIIISMIIITIVIRDIVIKAIDLWCKPDPPEDNFEEDASGWGSGDEVRITLFTIFLDRLGEPVGG